MSTPDSPDDITKTNLTTITDGGLTPETPAVAEVRQPRPGDSLKRQVVKNIVALGLIFGGAALTVISSSTSSKQGPPTPRPPRVHGNGTSDAGPDSDDGGDSSTGLGGAGGTLSAPDDAIETLATCPPRPDQMYPYPVDIFGIDDVHTRSGLPPSNAELGACEETADGYSGTEYVDNGKKIDCFLTPTWAPGSAVRISGKVSGNAKQPGVITLKDGLVDVMIGVKTSTDDAENNIQKEVQIEGVAGLIIKTTGRVSITKNPPNKNGAPQDEILVVAENGQTLIYREGEDPYVLNECEKIRVPLTAQNSGAGCYIADIDRRSQSTSNGAGLLLSAGAIFLAIRRKSKQA